MNETSIDPEISNASRRVTGIAALRRIRRIVDAETAQAELKSRWARRIGAVACVLGIIVVTWSIYRFLG